MFAEAIKNELNTTTMSVTENGAVGYATSGKNLVDMFFKVSSYRNLSDKEIENDFAKAWAEDPELALKFAFFVGDIREGLGERRMFRVILNWLARTTDIAHLMALVPEYNRFDSLFLLKGTQYEDQMVNYVKSKLTVDKTADHPSLLAKWMPSVNTSSKDSRDLARWFCNKFNMSEKEYRKTLSGIRNKLNIVETQMCAGKWDEVKYEAVPSKANLLYKDAFLKHDEARRKVFIDKVNAGEAKINAGVTMPHEIVHAYSDNRWCQVKAMDPALEALWKNLKNTVEGGHNIMVVRDGSGSMTSTIGGTSVSALEVATALSVYFSERQSGEFQNKFITFSSRPQFVDLSKCTTLQQKLTVCQSYDECSNTDIEATFDLVLRTAVKNHMKQEDIPDLLIVSDMEFDGATTNFGWRNTSDSAKATLFAKIEAKFNAAGYQLPKLIFWNVMSRTNTIPVQENVKGLALVSGFSTNVMDCVLSNKLDPFEILKEKLLKPRYEAITLAK